MQREAGGARPPLEDNTLPIVVRWIGSTSKD